MELYALIDLIPIEQWLGVDGIVNDTLECFNVKCGRVDECCATDSCGVVCRTGTGVARSRSRSRFSTLSNNLWLPYNSIHRRRPTSN